MIERKTWDEFRNCKMLWWINTFLSVFGWSIIVSVQDGKVAEAYPARVTCRGFDEEENEKGYIGVSKFLKENTDELLKEALLKEAKS